MLDLFLSRKKNLRRLFQMGAQYCFLYLIVHRRSLGVFLDQFACALGIVVSIFGTAVIKLWGGKFGVFFL